MDISALDISSVFGIAPWGVALVCVLVFLAGYVDAIAGGGGLISLPAYLIAGLPTHAAIATNKMSSTMGTFVATWHYARSGLINLRMALPCIACAFVGSGAGSTLLLCVGDEFLRVLLLVLLPATAIYVLRSKSLAGEVTRSYAATKTALIAMAIALVIGFYDGFYGPGTGTFLLLALTGLAHLRLDAAAGITKAINLSTNVASLVIFLAHGQTIIALGLVAGVFGIAGNYLGSHRFTEQGAGVAKPLIIFVIAVFFVKAVFDVVTS